MATIAVQADGVIESGKVYGLKEFKRITGLGDAAVRAARKKGLVIKRIGLRSYVRGEDWDAHVRDHGKSIE